MCKLWLLVACFACAADGRRLKATFDQHFSSKDAGRQRPMKQSFNSGSRLLHGQANHSGKSQLAKSIVTPRKIVSILLTFFSPALVFAPMPHGSASNSSAHNLSQMQSSSHSIGTNARPLVVMMGQDSVENVVPEDSAPIVHVVVSVDWEGEDLITENLQFFRYFRTAHPEVPLTHFLNAAYYTKNGPVQSRQEWSPSDAVSSIDELGLQIHGWKSLVESAGVEYRSEPSFWQSHEELEKSLEEDVGNDIDVRFYSVDQLQKIISHSKEILEREGLKVGKSFRVGSRLASPNVVEAFQREGFGVNSSALSVEGGEGDLTPEYLYTMRWEVWPGIDQEFEPDSVGDVLEMPQVGGHADLSTVTDMVDQIDIAVERLGSGDQFVQIGLTQESAATHGPKITAAISEFKRKHGHRVVFETLEASARRARSMLTSK